MVCDGLANSSVAASSGLNRGADGGLLEAPGGLKTGEGDNLEAASDD